MSETHWMIKIYSLVSFVQGKCVESEHNGIDKNEREKIPKRKSHIANEQKTHRHKNQIGMKRERESKKKKTDRNNRENNKMNENPAWKEQST